MRARFLQALVKRTRMADSPAHDRLTERIAERYKKAGHDYQQAIARFVDGAVGRAKSPDPNVREIAQKMWNSLLTMADDCARRLRAHIDNLLARQYESALRQQMGDFEEARAQAMSQLAAWQMCTTPG